MKTRRPAPEFDPIDTEYSILAKALSHPARIAIIKSLMKTNSQSCKELVDQLPFSQSTVSQHLYRLRSVGLVDSKGYKTSTIYNLNLKNLNRFNTLFHEVFAHKKDDRQLSLF